MDDTGLDLGLASEASFGAPAALPWLTVGTEWLTFVDCRRVSLRDDIEDWLRGVGFPSHGLNARPCGHP